MHSQIEESFINPEIKEKLEQYKKCIVFFERICEKMKERMGKLDSAARVFESGKKDDSFSHMASPLRQEEARLKFKSQFFSECRDIFKRSVENDSELEDIYTFSSGFLRPDELDFIFSGKEFKLAFELAEEDYNACVLSDDYIHNIEINTELGAIIIEQKHKYCKQEAVAILEHFKHYEMHYKMHYKQFFCHNSESLSFDIQEYRVPLFFHETGIQYGVKICDVKNVHFPMFIKVSEALVTKEWYNAKLQELAKSSLAAKIGQTGDFYSCAEATPTTPLFSGSGLEKKPGSENRGDVPRSSRNK